MGALQRGDVQRQAIGQRIARSEKRGSRVRHRSVPQVDESMLQCNQIFLSNQSLECSLVNVTPVAGWRKSALVHR
jgi:hypothetical protein